MTRILRIFALMSVVGLGLYLVGFFLYHAAALPVIGAGFGAVLGTYLLVAAVMAVAAWIGGSAASVVGVIAAVASVQRRQRGWAIALIGAVVLHYSYGLFLSFCSCFGAAVLPVTIHRGGRRTPARGRDGPPDRAPGPRLQLPANAKGRRCTR